MSKNQCRMTGFWMMLVSVFPILGGLYLKGEGIPDMVSFVCLIVGLVLLIIGIVFYKILIQE